MNGTPKLRSSRCVQCLNEFHQPWRGQSMYCGDACRRDNRRARTGYKPPLSLEERFWLRVERRSAAECWNWMHPMKSGYGSISVGGRAGTMKLAHRLSYELANGPIPDGLQILHSCDNPSCVNPNHLRAGTNLDNMRDMAIRERSSKRKLTAPEVIDIRRAHREGATQHDLARKYGCQQSNISAIVKRQTWRHVA